MTMGKTTEQRLAEIERLLKEIKKGKMKTVSASAVRQDRTRRVHNRAFRSNISKREKELMDRKTELKSQLENGTGFGMALPKNKTQSSSFTIKIKSLPKRKKVFK